MREHPAGSALPRGWRRWRDRGVVVGVAAAACSVAAASELGHVWTLAVVAAGAPVGALVGAFTWEARARRRDRALAAAEIAGKVRHIRDFRPPRRYGAA